MKKIKQKWIFDEEFRLDKINWASRQTPLEKLQNHIDLEFFRNRWRSSLMKMLTGVRRAALV